MGISVSGPLAQQMRQLDNYLGSAVSHVRQGTLDHPMFEDLGEKAAIARELAPHAPESRYFARVQGALTEASKDTARSSAFRTAILEARREMDLGMANVSARPHLAQHQTSDGAVGIAASAEHSPHFGADGLDALGNVSASSHHVGNDGQAFAHDGSAAGDAAWNDHSADVLF